MIYETGHIALQDLPIQEMKQTVSQAKMAHTGML
jgi:hypothetical protein